MVNTFLSALRSKRQRGKRAIGELLIVISGLVTSKGITFLIAFLIAVPAGVLISGPLSLWFWIGVILIGMAVPFVLELVTWRTSPTILVVTMAICVLIGGIVLRAVVVVGGQI